jgi:hypothetical protein
MKLLLVFALCLSSAFAQGTKSNPTAVQDRKIDAKTLLAEIVFREPTERTEMVGTLKIRSAEGKSRRVPVRWITKPGNGDWNDVYQTPEKSEIPPEQLIIVHREGVTNRYTYLRNGAPIADISTNLFIPFGTSDFCLADFGLEFMHWPNPKHLKTEMRNSRACYVIETRNPTPQPGAYGRVLCWIDTEHRGLYRAEAYDAKDQLLKEFSVRGVSKGRIKALHIRNEQTDSSTLLEFDLEVPLQKESDSP